MIVYEPMDTRAKRGRFPLSEAMCWNHMTRPQQTLLADMGQIRDYGGGPCGNRAEVEIDVGDEGPGPRFYCRRCAPEVS